MHLNKGVEKDYLRNKLKGVVDKSSSSTMEENMGRERRGQMIEKQELVETGEGHMGGGD